MVGTNVEPYDIFDLVKLRINTGALAAFDLSGAIIYYGCIEKM